MRKVYHIILPLAFMFFLIAGCMDNKNGNNKPIARVFDKNLYLSDIQEIFPKDMNPTDSAQFLMAYIERWVRKELLLHRAEKNLTESQKNVSQQLDDYRSSLLIFKYEQEYIRQKLDTIISFNEIEEFYRENSTNFTLDESIVKALFIKIRMDDPYYDKIKELYRSTKEDDIKALDNMAYQVAIKYDYFNDQWVPYTRILRELPEPLNNAEAYLLTNKSIEMNDGIHAYLVNFRDVLHRGQQSPLVYERDNIQSIILNKRKQRLIIDLETKIYNDAKDYNHFTVFQN